MSGMEELLCTPEEAILAGRSPVHFWQTVARDFRIYKTERDES